MTVTSVSERCKRVASHPWISGIALLCLGVMQAFSLAWPGHGQPVWWLQILSLAGAFALLLQARSPGQAAWRAWLFALAWLAGTFWWLFISMHTYGGLPAPLAAMAVFALAAFLAVYYAAAAWLWRRSGAQQGVVAVVMLAACWTLAELARGNWFTGFPWGAGGYAHVDGWLAGLPRWVGAYGVGAFATALAACLALMGRVQSRSKSVGIALCGGLLIAGIAQWGQSSLLASVSPRPAISVALLQGNIAQDEKFVPGGGVEAALQWYGEQLLQQPAQLVVAPETALPMLPQQLPQGYWEAVSAPYQAPSSTSAALVGMPLGNRMQGYTNSVIGWIPGEMTEYRYDKHHLVPFGEFIPPMFHWFVRMMNIPLGDFQRGSAAQASLSWLGERWAPNICYEDLFGEELGKRFSKGESAPTVLVNVSNIAWFGNSIAIDQHLHISRMRTLEFERPMLRATNTGATVVIDHRGVVTAALQPHTQAVLLAQVQGRDGLTPFAQWVSRWGLWPLWLGCLAVALVCARQRKQI